MSEQNEEVRVEHEPDESRYAIYAGSELAGFAEYRSRSDGATFAFTHTEVFDEFGGRGLAKTLVHEAMSDTRNRGVRIVPYCPFVASWLKKHPEFEDAVDWPERKTS